VEYVACGGGERTTTFRQIRRSKPDEKVYPAAAVSETELASLGAELKAYPAADLAYFTDYAFDPRFREKYRNDSYEYIRNELLNSFMSNFLLDRFKSRAALNRMSRDQYHFLGIYFYALDVAGHAFTRFRQPDLFADVESRDPFISAE